MVRRVIHLSGVYTSGAVVPIGGWGTRKMVAAGAWEEESPWAAVGAHVMMRVVEIALTPAWSVAATTLGVGIEVGAAVGWRGEGAGGSQLTAAAAISGSLEEVAICRRNWMLEAVMGAATMVVWSRRWGMC